MMDLAISILVASWAMLEQMAPYLLLGFVAAGLLSVLISPTLVERHLGNRGLGQVFKASLFGVPLPLCSCGVIPVGASLRRHGAGKGATTAFLLSTPQTGVDSIAVTYALLGPFLAVVRPVAALLTGFVGGGLVTVVDRDGDETKRDGERPEEDCGNGRCSVDETPERKTILEGLTYGLVTLPRDIGRALVVGILLSGVISALVEPRALEGTLGGGLWPMLAAMVVGVPLYVCATASTPIALSLIHAGLSPGAALVFLITGPATNLATVTTLWRILGRRSVVVFLLTVALGALATGLVVDGLAASGWVAADAMVPAVDGASAGHAHHGDEGEPTSPLGTIAAWALILVLANAMWPQPKPFPERYRMTNDHEDDRIELAVTGMRCNGCVESVTRALNECDGVDEASVDLAGGRARVRGSDLDHAAVVAAVRSLGFDVEVVGADGPP